MWRYTNIVYIRSCLVLTYIEIFFSIVCCFFGHICWSVNCISWASKFRNFFWIARKLRQDLYLRSLCIALYGNFGTFLVILIWLVNCSRDFFSYLVSQQIVLAESLNHVKNISRRYPEAQALIYIWDLVVVLFMESFVLFAPFQTCSFHLIAQIWSTNYALHIWCVKIHRHCLYWCVFSTK